MRTRSGIAPQAVRGSIRLAAQCHCVPVNSNVRPHMGNVSLIDNRLAPSSPLPEGFQYPAAFLQYLLYEERELGEDPDRDVLRWIWPADLRYEEGRVAYSLAAHERATPGRTNFYLVPFAHDAGDGMWFFTPDGIHFIDMGWKEWVPRPEPDRDFVEFVNRQRKGSYMREWRPE